MKGRHRKASGGSTGSGHPDMADQNASGTSGIGRPGPVTPKKCGGRVQKKSGGCVRDDDKDAMSCGGRLDRKPRKSGGRMGSADGAKNVSASVSSPLAKK